MIYRIFEDTPLTVVADGRVLFQHINGWYAAQGQLDMFDLINWLAKNNQWQSVIVSSSEWNLELHNTDGFSLEAEHIGQKFVYSAVFTGEDMVIMPACRGQQPLFYIAQAILDHGHFTRGSGWTYSITVPGGDMIELHCKGG